VNFGVKRQTYLPTHPPPRPPAAKPTYLPTYPPTYLPTTTYLPTVRLVRYKSNSPGTLLSASSCSLCLVAREYRRAVVFFIERVLLVFETGATRDARRVCCFQAVRLVVFKARLVVEIARQVARNGSNLALRRSPPARGGPTYLPTCPARPAAAKPTYLPTYLSVTRPT
jgi:hypothetical protein